MTMLNTLKYLWNKYPFTHHAELTDNKTFVILPSHLSPLIFKETTQGKIRYWFAFYHLGFAQVWLLPRHYGSNNRVFLGGPVVKTPTLSLQVAQASSLVGELRSHMLHGAVRKKKRSNNSSPKIKPLGLLQFWSPELIFYKWLLLLFMRDF